MAEPGIGLVLRAVEEIDPGQNEQLLVLPHQRQGLGFRLAVRGQRDTQIDLVAIDADARDLALRLVPIDLARRGIDESALFGVVRTLLVRPVCPAPVLLLRVGAEFERDSSWARVSAIPAARNAADKAQSTTVDP
jgi:hypothetical protein